jgi:TrpR-related protein YerC/YecD
MRPKKNEESEHYVDLFEAIENLNNKKECESFFRDLCTPQELAAMKSRWLVCQILVEAKKSYREISKDSGASLATITRVARFLHTEPHKGYKLMLKKLQGKKDNEKDTVACTTI